MDIRKLQAFSKVYERSSFSRAGEELYLSQPTISAHVAALESELEVRLFDRIGRSILPTPAADVLYRRGKEIFQIVNLAKAEIEMLNGTISGTLVVGGSTIPGQYILPEILTEFRSSYPSVSIDLHCSDSQNIVHMVRDGHLMCGVVGGCLDERELTFLPVLDDKLIAVARPELAARYSNATLLSQALDAPWVMREKGSGTRACLEESIDRLGLAFDDFNVVAQARTTETMVRFVQAGMGLGVTSRFVVAPLLASKELVSLEFNDFQATRKFFIVYHSKRQLFPNTRALIAFMDSKILEKFA